MLAAKKSYCRLVLELAGVALLGLWGVDTAGAVATVTYTGISGPPPGDDVSISAPNNVAGIAGQIVLTGVTLSGVTGAPSPFVAWCVDIYDYLNDFGTYTVGTPGSAADHNSALDGLSAANISKIGGLMVEGNNLLKNGLTGAFSSYNKNDVSAAVQVAIWSIEYGSSFAYKINTSGRLNAPGTSNPGSGLGSFGYLVSLLTTDAGTSSWSTIYSLNNNSLNNQELGFVPVPGPTVGAGTPGMALLAFGGLLLWHRRQRAV